MTLVPILIDTNPADPLYNNPDYEGQGVASFARRQLIAIADSILTRQGFVFSEIVQDDEIGDAWAYELRRD